MLVHTLSSMLNPIDEVSHSDDDAEEPGLVGPSSLKPVSAISSASDGSEAGQGPLNKRTCKNKKNKRRRATDKPSVKERLTSESYLTQMVGKKCLKCKQNCMIRFSTEEKMMELRSFRDHWVSLNKLDQDQIAAWFTLGLPL